MFDARDARLDINRLVKDFEAMNSKSEQSVRQFGAVGKSLENLGNKYKKAKDGLDIVAHSMQALAGGLSIIKDSYAFLGKISGLATTFTRTADEIANLNSRLKLASASTAEYISQQKALLNIANSSYSKLSDTTDLYIKMAQGLKPLGYELKEINAVTASFSKALQLGGASA